MLVWADAAYNAGYIVGRVAVIVVLIGVVVAILRRTVFSRADEGAAPASNRATRQCPGCAKTVPAEDQVCKHCRYRFAPNPVQQG
ncbi:MAG: hypothetical protein JOZ73_04620 [Solirubrobacterales bacterium]|nr:hypothetical protein [Solirubrobacterales bacterium]